MEIGGRRLRLGDNIVPFGRAIHGHKPFFRVSYSQGNQSLSIATVGESFKADSFSEKGFTSESQNRM